MDSRTLLPPDLSVGMAMRAEFLLMENGQFYARRVIPNRGYSYSKAPRASISSDPIEGVDPVALETAPVAVNSEPVAIERVPLEDHRVNEVSTTTPTMAQTTDADVSATAEAISDDDDTLPQTGSRSPMIATFGLFAVAAATGLLLARRPRRARRYPRWTAW
ncbi:MAG: LPXTG cell wall anchor domain-containing protein [Candidatus Eisenbacteria bacterium]|uniref:LPXTG cell wall anchor domain-containing protein n=1 Tax=Eiseniibacteriota bacterium TaxID=2212470 RepID=A0A849SRQ7_UNCEI|nr:LPXTG cell wall anchor domain-containing protein [Candidatus Eisenbacteria bacterium]